MLKHSKIIVVGGNAAGPAAAAKAKRINPEAEVLMFESGDYISTGTCEIPYVLSGEITDPEQLLTFSPEEFRKEKGVKVFTGCEVTGINRDKKFVKVYNGKIRREYKEKYDSLILATGSSAAGIADFPEFSPNLFTLKNIADLKKLTEFVDSRSIESVVVVGSGYIGLETADAFHNTGKDVALIEKQKLPLPYAEPEVSRLILELLGENNISFYGAFKDLLLTEEKGFIRSINLDGRIIKSDIIISAVGFKPNSDLAQKAGLQVTPKGSIKVDRHLKTSDPNIWACGDNIEIVNEVTKNNDYFPVATIARDFAYAAAENAAGGDVSVNPVIKNIAVRILDKYQVSVGITEKEAKENSIPCRTTDATASNLVKPMPESQKVYGKIVYHAVNKTILGAAFLGGREVSGYGDLISALIKIKSPADILASINYNYTPPLSPFVNLLSVLGKKVK